jgi:hypothetical protein
MSFNTTRTEAGGMVIEFDRREGKGRVEFDSAGQVIAAECHIKEIVPPTPAEIEEARQRAQMNRDCCG